MNLYHFLWRIQWWYPNPEKTHKNEFSKILHGSGTVNIWSKSGQTSIKCLSTNSLFFSKIVHAAGTVTIWLQICQIGPTIVANLIFGNCSRFWTTQHLVKHVSNIDASPVQKSLKINFWKLFMLLRQSNYCQKIGQQSLNKIKKLKMEKNK